MVVEPLAGESKTAPEACRGIGVRQGRQEGTTGRVQGRRRRFRLTNDAELPLVEGVHADDCRSDR